MIQNSDEKLTFPAVKAQKSTIKIPKMPLCVKIKTL
jgi:hypothetical protein